jgi:hypothetical protein
VIEMTNMLQHPEHHEARSLSQSRLIPIEPADLAL